MPASTCRAARPPLPPWESDVAGCRDWRLRVALGDLGAYQPFRPRHLHHRPPVVDRQPRLETVAPDARQQLALDDVVAASVAVGAHVEARIVMKTVRAVGQRAV